MKYTLCTNRPNKMISKYGKYFIKSFTNFGLIFRIFRYDQKRWENKITHLRFKKTDKIVNSMINRALSHSFYSAFQKFSFAFCYKETDEWKKLRLVQEMNAFVPYEWFSIHIVFVHLSILALWLGLAWLTTINCLVEIAK